MIKETRRRHHKMVLLAVAYGAVLVSTIPAEAQTITPQLDELILGFRATGAPGQTLDLEVDLGNMSNFYGATAGPTNLLPALAVQDLVNVYGASWSTRTDLVWGAVATTGRSTGTSDGHAPVGTLWATRPNGLPAWNAGSIFAQKTASGTIEAMLVSGSAGSLYGATSTTNSSEAAVIDATQPGSWTAQDLKAAGESFGYFNPTIDNVAAVSLSGQVVSALYELQPTNASGAAGKFLGDLILTTAGVSFQAAAATVPAPVAGFSGSPTNGVAPLTVNFVDSSTGTITNRLWAFGDGVTTNATNPSHTYVSGGSYSVTLTVFGPGGLNTLTQTNYILVGAANDVQSYIVAAKGQNYTQIDTNTVTPQVNGFGLHTEVQPAQSNVVSSASLQLPAGAITNLIESSGSGDFSADLAFPDKLSLDSACPTGTYTLTVVTIGEGSPSSALSMPADDYPNVPQVVNFTAAQAVDTTSGFTLIWTAFAGGATSDYIRVEIDDAATQVVFQTPSIAQAGSLNGTNTSVVVSPGTLLPGTNYTGRVMFFHPTTIDTTSIPGATGSIGFYQRTSFSIVTLGGQPPAITTGSPLPDGAVGIAYVGALAATGGTQPYSWSVVSNSLPTGLALVTGTGAITGTPTVATTANFTVQVEDASSLVSNKNFMLTIDPASIQIIGLGGNLVFGNVTTGATATATLTITNSGNAALTVTSITYPSGFSGAFSGVIGIGTAASVPVTFAPTALISYGGTITVNSGATSGTSTIAISGTGAPVPTRIIGLSGSLTFGNVTTGITATAVLTIANSGNATLTVSSITYPSGFSGAFSGAILAGGSTNVTVTFAPSAVISYGGTVTVSSDANSGTGTLLAFGAGLALPSPPTILTASLLPTGTVGQAYSQPLAATGGATPYQWSLASGQLPSGLTLSANGVIGGTPLVATSVSFSVRVVGADALFSTGTFSLAVQTGSVSSVTAGPYNGLAFLSNNLADEVAGFARVTVTKAGIFQAQIMLDGARYIGHGQFNSSGDWTGPLGGLGATLHLDVFNNTDQITGTLTLGGFTGSLLANRAAFGAGNPAPWTGTYTTLLTGSTDPSVPSGLGWANLQISSSGMVILRGELGDGSKFNEVAFISKFGTWPLFSTPAGPHSVVAGWVTMTNTPVVVDSESMPSDLNADLLWSRPANPRSQFFPAGFNTQLTLLGSKYTIPAPGTSILPVLDTTCNTWVIFGGGNLSGIVTNTVTLTISDRVIDCGGGTLSLAVTPSRGSFSGAFAPPGMTKKLRLSGLFLQNSSIGGGYFVGTNTTGYVTIEPIIEPAP
jgi:PKD repeat protein